MKKNIKQQKRIRRHTKIRTRVSGTSSVPRLAIFRSNRFIYAQLIDDSTSKTLASASSVKQSGKMTKSVSASSVGKEIASKAKDLKITSVVFDRGGFGYKGRVKSLAEGAREGGLKF